MIFKLLHVTILEEISIDLHDWKLKLILLLFYCIRNGKYLMFYRYEMWLKGEDIGPHPEEPDRKMAAPLPLPQDILCNKNNPYLPQSFLEAPKKGRKGRMQAYK